jgi:hypothetical protein
MVLGLLEIFIWHRIILKVKRKILIKLF